MTQKLVLAGVFLLSALALSACEDTGYTVHNALKSDATREHEKDVIMDEPLIARQNDINQSDNMEPKNPPEILKNDRVDNAVPPVPASTSSNAVPEAVTPPDEYPSRR